MDECVGTAQHHVDGTAESTQYLIRPLGHSDAVGMKLLTPTEDTPGCVGSHTCLAHRVKSTLVIRSRTLSNEAGLALDEDFAL